MFLLRRTGPQPISRSIVRAMSSSQQQSTVRFQFSAGEDEEQLSRDATALVTEGQGRWKVTDDNRGLERTFRFKTFKATWVRKDSAFLACR
jgi:4a-hydroxytetrahydrobiopterin dehydratase